MPVEWIVSNTNACSHRWEPDRKEWVKTPEKRAEEEEAQRKKEEKDKEGK